eukprot:maker-scaffold1126_size61158-snap-gene-0.11 protein:Tk03416 transcript:maker-scaffold1126_size61158-snap-gene-0.11-mRNA-1 annotation:"hypothetical protein TRIADDRAFT_56004"
MFVMGGVGEKSVEIINLKAELEGEDKLPEWRLGPDLPEVMARSCAALVDNDTVIIVGGHDNSSSQSLPLGYMLKILDNQWTEIPNMNVPRRDHACLFVEFEKARGILVTGGLSDNEEVLDSAEFFDLQTEEWTITSGMKIGRTEHVMSLVYGIPTVIGGLSTRGFLTSIEQFDKSSASWNVPLERDWQIINNALGAPRYEMTAASLPVSIVQRTRLDHDEVLDWNIWNIFLLITGILVIYMTMNVISLCLTACLFGFGSRKSKKDDLNRKDFERSSIYKVVNGIVLESFSDLESDNGSVDASVTSQDTSTILGTVEIHSSATILSVVPTEANSIKSATPNPPIVTVGLGEEFVEMNLPNVADAN